MADPATPPPAPAADTTRVFLSYSRKDSAIMQRLADGLLAHPEYEPDYDRAEHDPHNVNSGIAADEPWWQRLEEMIAGADIMVFLVSPHSASSRVCDEEIAYAERLGKRIVPVLVAPVGYARLPPKLAALNINIDLTDAGPGFTAGFDDLLTALSVNATWLRQGRRYAERAAEWQRKGQPEGGLLPSGAFEEAESWASRRPRNEPEPGEVFTDWMNASRKNIQDQIAREQRQIRRARRWQAAASLVLVIALIGVALGGWQVTQGLRRVALGNSTVLTFFSEEADARGPSEEAEARDPDRLRRTRDGGARAARLALAAYSDSALAPVAQGADFRLGEAMGRAQLPVALEGHTDYLSVAAFLPDGRHVVTASNDGTARVWTEGEDGVWTTRVLKGHGSTVHFAAFSPDGRRVVTASGDDTARVWTKGDGEVWTAAPLKGHQRGSISRNPWAARVGGVVTAAFSPDGRAIVTASDDGTARVRREGENGVWTDMVLEGHEGPVTSAAFFPDGQRVVTASEDNDARVWREGQDGVWTAAVLEGHKGPVLSAFSPDGRAIITASEDETARVWREGGDGVWTATKLEGHKGPVTSAAFFPDGQRVVTASEDNDARVWREEQGGVWTATLLEGHEDDVNSAALSPDGRRLVTASREGTARVWRERKEDVWMATALEGHERPVTSAAFSPDGQRIVTASYDDTARVWREGEDGVWTTTVLEEPESHMHAAAFSTDGQRLVTASFDRTARVWREGDNGVWTATVLGGHRDEVRSAAFSPDGKRLVTASFDSKARVWREGEDGVWTDTPLEGHGGDVNSASFSPDGQRVVTASGDGTARVWRERENGVWTATPLEGHGGDVNSASFSPDGQHVVTASDDNTARVWSEFDGGVWVSTELNGYGGVVYSAPFSLDGRRVVTASQDNTARVWRQEEAGVWTGTRLEGHEREAGAANPWAVRERGVDTAAFSPDGRSVLTVSEDGTARVWREEDDGVWSATVLEMQYTEVVSAAFTPDGRRVVTVLKIGIALVWREREDSVWSATRLEGHEEDMLTSAIFSPDGRRVVMAYHDGTARVSEIDSLMGDPWREALNQRAGEVIWPALKPAVCKRLRAASAVEVTDPGTGVTRVKHVYTELTDEDLRAAPLLRTMGYRAGDDICEASAPTGLNALLTQTLPRHWWSGLDWGE